MHNDGESSPRMLPEANNSAIPFLIGSSQIRSHIEFWYAE